MLFICHNLVHQDQRECYVISLLGVPEHIPSCTADVGKRSNCPSGCKCTDGVVDCRNRGLRHIPDNLPIDMTEM